MNSSDAVSVGSVFDAASPQAMRAPVTAVRARMILLARSAVSLIHSLRNAAGTARRSFDRVRAAKPSLVVKVIVGLVMLMVRVPLRLECRSGLEGSGGGELGGRPGHVEEGLLERRGDLAELGEADAVLEPEL